jgi:2-methylisocitrate lyase-like PEP mutase family enzyme
VTDVADRARALRALHRPGDPLVLANVWDAASARTVASVPGCRAVATASWSIAAAHGVADGERIDRDLMLAAVARIVAAVDVPVTADLEGGYGDTPADVAETVARAIAVGAVGANLEDRLRPVAEQAAIVAAVRERADREGVPFVINARTDEFLHGGRLLDEAVRRGRAYRDAGADCVFVPGLLDPALIARLVADVDAPINVLAGAAAPPLAALAAAGVARVSFGPGPMGVAYAALRRAAESLHAGGTYPSDLAYRPPVGDG